MDTNEMDIFRVRPDKSTKVGSVIFDEKSLKSESNLVAALKGSVKNMDDGAYSVHPANRMFARFDLANHMIKLERRSENTGVMMPCWKDFEE